MNHDVNEMSVPLNSPATKWNQIVPALEQVVGHIASINWGLWLFPIRSNIDGCGVSLNPDVPIGSGSDMITTVLSTTTPAGETPTSAALTRATAYFQNLADNHKHYLLLATDGLPNCNSGAADDTDNAVGAISAALNVGIPTVVVGIGNTSSEQSSLTRMAMAGGLPNGQTYYTVNTTGDLESLLESIVSQVVSCEFSLSSPPDDESNVRVDSSIGPIPRDTTGASGWNFGSGDHSIIFSGDTCMKIKLGMITDITVNYDCIM
jgi:hypothetical protein